MYSFASFADRNWPLSQFPFLYFPNKSIFSWPSNGITILDAYYLSITYSYTWPTVMVLLFSSTKVLFLEPNKRLAWWCYDSNNIISLIKWSGVTSNGMIDISSSVFIEIINFTTIRTVYISNLVTMWPA